MAQTISSNKTVEAVRPKNATAQWAPVSGQRVSGLVPPLGWVRFEATTSDKFVVVVKLNGDSPQQTAGSGGYTVRDRAGRVGATRWQGRAPLEVPVGVIFDSVTDGKSVEHEIDTLKVLAGLGASGGVPPVVMDSAGLIAWDYQHDPTRTWVISDLQPERTGDLRNHAGHLIRAAFTVVLWEYVADQIVPEQSLARRRAPGKRSISKATYKVKQGDTLVSIARKQLGSADRWLELAKLNGLRGQETLKPGTTIRLK